MLTWSLEPLTISPGLSFPPVGAHASRDGVVYRVWAPDHAAVRVVVGRPEYDTRYIELARDAEGFHTGRDDLGRTGDRYWFQLGEADARLVADPASRFQPEGIETASEVIDPTLYEWRAADWRRPPLRRPSRSGANLCSGDLRSLSCLPPLFTMKARMAQAGVSGMRSG